MIRGQDVQASYEYGVPDNPLVIARPAEPEEEDQALSDSSLLADSQAAPKQGGGGGGGGHHHHHDSDDPLAWLRESVPGSLQQQ